MGIQCLLYGNLMVQKIDCIKKFCESLRGHPMKIMNFEMTKQIKQTVLFGKKLKMNTLMIKFIVKLKTIVMTLTNTEVQHISYEI